MRWMMMHDRRIQISNRAAGSEHVERDQFFFPSDKKARLLTAHLPEHIGPENTGARYVARQRRTG